MTNNTLQPENCICASFYIVRGKHKPDCPLYDNTPDKEIDEMLARYKNAYQIAFHEIDPHGNKMSPYNGQKAVSKRSNEIEMEAYNKLKSLIQTREKKMLEFVIPKKKFEYINDTYKQSAYFPEIVGFNRAIDDINQRAKERME